MTDITARTTSASRLPGLPAGEVAEDDPAWWADMTAWTDVRLAERGIRRDGPLVPVRVWARSAVSHFETDRGRMWAKAVPGIFAHEIALTELIADIDPGAAPPVVAAEAGLGRILTDHVEGAMLTDAAEPIAWTATLSRMAELQRVLAADLAALDIAGVARAPVGRLAELVPELLADDGLLGLGRSSGLSVHQAAALRARESDLVAACRALAASPVPDSLDHGDLTPDEVIVGEMGPVFLDWSDGSVTHPFLSAASFLAAVDVRSKPAPAAHDEIADAYLGPWLPASRISLDDAREVLALARIVHPLHVAAQYAERVRPGLGDSADAERVVADRLRSLL
jgi:hypothetical protein